MKTNPKKVVLAYSGGLDTSAIIPWLKEQYDCDVYAFVGNVGQGDEELEGIEQKAISSGAKACFVADLRDAFVKDYIFPMVKLGAVYENGYLLGTSIARPIIAKAQVEYALDIGADALCHGCTGKGNDQVRFESTYAALAPQLKVIAPWRIWSMSSRAELLGYLEAKNVPCSASVEKMYSRDGNLWHLSHEGAELEDPWSSPKDEAWQLTADPKSAADEGATIKLSFEQGELTAIDDKTYSPSMLISVLNELASANGVGRIDIVENRLVGMKSRGCYETPGGTVIVKAIAALDELVLDRESQQFKFEVGRKFANMLYDGKWFTPLCQTLVNLGHDMSTKLTGDVVVELYKGNVIIKQRQSPYSLYDEDFATFDTDSVYDQSDAEGFIRLFSLPSKIQHLKNKGEK